MSAPSVSIVIPCRNERGFIEGCLESIVANGYPLEDLEVLVVDAMSTDGTRELLTRLVERYPFVRVIDNPAGVTPVALNLGIRAARGTVIVRIDGHAIIQPGYLVKCVTALRAGKANNVGGVMQIVPQTASLFGRAVAACLSHSFGAGGPRYRTGSRDPVLVDTVQGGCYDRSIFEEIGYFNERLRRSQDMEFNRRLKIHGGRILLLPDVVYVYYSRSSFVVFLRHNWTNGVWAILPFLYSDVTPVSFRHLVPLMFVVALTGALGLSLALPTVGIWPLALVAGPYAVVCLSSAIQMVWTRREPLVALMSPFVFLSMHLCYGLGSCWGILKAIGISVRRMSTTDNSSSVQAN
jgi:glycosyltransferase involved in cell wall biosynthesis